MVRVKATGGVAPPTQRRNEDGWITRAYVEKTSGEQ
jgi:hypothetical protein